MAPKREMYTAKDGERIEFRVISLGTQGMLIELLNQHRCRIGYANVSYLGESIWHLSNIFIDDDVPMRAWYQCHIGRWNFFGQPNTRNYRNQGIGTALMDYLKRTAQARGVREISAAILHVDLANTPHLLDWYVKQGFRVTLRTAGAGKAGDTKLIWHQRSL